MGDVLGDTYTDAYLVLQDGALVAEWYGPLGAPDRPHALMSVSKSVVGCVAAVLIDRGLLDPDAEITSYVPELAGSGYAGALVRHVYDMRSGVRFGEEYANPDVGHPAAGRLGRLADPSRQGEPRGLYRFLATLRAEAPHGERFLYRSAESDVLGWVCERAAGRPMADADLRADLGADGGRARRRSCCTTAWAPRCTTAGLCATARDVARFGQLLLDGGRGAGRRRTSEPGRGVLPPQWLRRAWAVDADARSVFAASPAEWAFPGGWYRHQFWFRPGDHGDVLLCLGIHGQMLHVSRRTAHGLREALDLAGRAEPGVPGGHAARLRRRRRVPGRPGPRGARRPPAGRGRLRPEPPRRRRARHGPPWSEPARDRFSTADRPGLNLAVSAADREAS